MNKWKVTFFNIWIGQAFSLFGSSLVDFALIWWLTEVTGSERILVVSSLLTLLPKMILGPFAGSIIDWFSRKRIMILADGSIALITIGLLAIYLSGNISVAAVMVVLLFRSLGSMFHQPAMKSATALLVPAEQLARIAGLNRILSGGMNIISPVAGAALIQLFDIPSILYIDVVTASIAIITLFFSHIPNPVHPESKDQKAIVQETLDGLKYVLKTKSLLFVVGTCTITNICLGPSGALQSLLVTSVFHGGVMELSWVTAANGLGMITGGIILGIWGGCKRNLITSAIGWGGFGIAYGAIALIPTDQILLLVLCMFLTGVFLAIGCSGLDAFYETKVPQEYHGRVFSVLTTLDSTTMPLGLIAAAFLGDLVPIRFWYLVTGILHFSLFVFWTQSKELKAAE